MMTLLLALLAMHIPLAALPAAGADASPSASPTELLTVIEQPVWSRRDNQMYAKLTLTAYDPASAQRRELAVLETRSSGVGLYWTSLGDSLITVDRKTAGALIQMRKGQRTTTPLPEGVRTDVKGGERCIRSLELSPDGRGWLMRVGPSSLVLHHEQTTRTFDLDWIDWESGDGVYETAYSWSPDSRKAAFYYGYSQSRGGSTIIGAFGIALVTLDDGVVELVKPSGRRTAGLADPAWPPQWSPDSRYVYFIQGPAAQEEVSPKVYPIYTYRVDTQTGQEEKLIQGLVTSVAPDNTYILLCTHSVTTESGDVEYRSAKLDLRTRQVELLPPLVFSPRISPSGRYVAAVYGTTRPPTVRFLDPSDWSVISETGPLPVTGSLAGWYALWRWITLEAPSQPAVPTTQP